MKIVGIKIQNHPAETSHESAGALLVSVLRIQGSAAVGVDGGNHLITALINDAVVTPVGAAAGLGFQVGPVFDGKTPLFAPAIGMKRLNDIHGRPATQLMSPDKTRRAAAA
jgi:hypothetical protein